MATYIDPPRKLYAHMDRLALVRAGHKPPPVNIEIDLSNRCSLGCEWCHFAYTHTRGPLAGKRDKPPTATAGGDLMDTTLALGLIAELAGYGVRSITWAGGGEPTLHPDFNTIIETCGSYAELDQGVYTNGAHIDPVRAGVLRRSTTWTYVSLDECTRADYLASKGVDAFDRVCGNTQRLATQQGSATVGVGFLLHRRNWAKLHDMIALGRSLGAQYVQFRPTVLYDQTQPGTLAEDTAWLSECIAALEAIDAPDVIADPGRFRRYRDWQGHGYQTCWYSALATVITPNGKVWRCVSKREHAGAELGDLTTESFAAIWARAGGPCGVDGGCRLMCCGEAANGPLQAMMVPQAHEAFI